MSQHPGTTLESSAKSLYEVTGNISDLNTLLIGVDELRAKTRSDSGAKGDVVITTNEVGQIVAVTRQDSEGRILSVIAEAAPVPPGYKLVLVPEEAAPDEPDWEDVRRQAEVSTGIKVNDHTMSIMIREVRRWIAHKSRISGKALCLPITGQKESAPVTLQQHAQPARLPLALASAPERIWLDLGFNPYEQDAHFSTFHDLTWSPDNASGHGIEYVRADRAMRAAQPAQSDRLFELWWAEYMPGATQAPAWAAWCAAHQQAAPAAGAVAGSGKVVAHRLVRKSLSGEWASDARDWSDGPPSKGLIESIRADNGRWRIDVAYAEPTTQPAEQFQSRVQPWMMECFGPVIAADRTERNHRFLEEALELVQATGCTQSEAHQLVDYVFGRHVGEPVQEVGGVMVTLAALCLANNIDMHDAGDTELARIWTNVEAIRAKQAAKPKHSPLPQAAPQQEAQEPVMIYHGGCTIDCGEHGHHNVELLRMIPAGSKLYTAPQPSPAPQGNTQIAPADVLLRTAIAETLYQQVRIEHDNRIGPWSAFDVREQQRIVDSIQGLCSVFAPASQGNELDAARLDWLDKNIFYRDMPEWDAKYVHGSAYYNMWVLFAPKVAQGSARKIIDAARAAQGK